VALRVVWACAAEKDLDAAAAYIHRDSPAYAASFVVRVLQTARSVGEFAERGRMVPEFRDKRIRELFIYSYRLIYRIESERIVILGLIHGRRDFSAAWSKKDRE